MGFGAALSIVIAADTLSITTMELVDNAVMYAIPGAMHATLVDPLFWISMPIALTVAFIAALPVNIYLLSKNKGHALTMNALAGYSGHDHHH
jgi:Sec-independent protein secretion pathway component TatC